MICTGIDLGGTLIKLVRYSPSGACLTRATCPTGDAYGGNVPAFVESIRALLREHASPGDRLGVSAPGLAARDAGSIAFMPGRLHGLEGARWCELLDRPVVVLNDAHAALLGEMRLGAARDLRDVILLTLGTGVGGAAVLDGKLLRGHLGRAGHFGHLCLDVSGSAGITGTPGSLEDAMGDHSVAARSGGRFADTAALVAAHRAGDAIASEIWLRSVQALACGITSLINVLDPEVVVIGGGITKAGPALFEPLAGFLDTVEWRPGGHRVRILPATLGEWAGATGAARAAHETFNL